MTRHGITLFKGLEVKDVSVLSFDIEATTLMHNENSKVLIISNTFRDRFGTIIKRMFSVDDYNNDREMIIDWCRWVKIMNPSIKT